MKKLLLSTLFTFTSFLLFAAAGGNGNGMGTPGGGGGMGNNGMGPNSGVPIDGGIGFLIAGGLLYGAKKTYDLRKDENQKH